MSTGIVAVIVVIEATAFGVTAVMRGRRLRRRFGPEYDGLADERDSKRKAEAELTGRERRVRDLGIQPLTDPAREPCARQWTVIQERLVDSPAAAVRGAQFARQCPILDMDLSIRDVNGRADVALRGELDLADTPGVGSHLVAAVAACGPSVTMDMASLDGIGDDGLPVLLRAPAGLWSCW